MTSYEFLLSIYARLIHPLNPPDSVDLLQIDRPVKGRVNGFESYLAMLVRLQPEEHFRSYIRFMVLRVSDVSQSHVTCARNAVCVWDAGERTDGKFTLHLNGTICPDSRLEAYLRRCLEDVGPLEISGFSEKLEVASH